MKSHVSDWNFQSCGGLGGSFCLHSAQDRTGTAAQKDELHNHLPLMGFSDYSSTQLWVSQEAPSADGRWVRHWGQIKAMVFGFVGVFIGLAAGVAAGIWVSTNSFSWLSCRYNRLKHIWKDADPYWLNIHINLFISTNQFLSAWTKLENTCTAELDKACRGHAQSTFEHSWIVLANACIHVFWTYTKEIGHIFAVFWWLFTRLGHPLGTSLALKIFEGFLRKFLVREKIDLMEEALYVWRWW
jgi:hypothetical protein